MEKKNVTGALVIHKANGQDWGQGKVKSIKGNKITISFQSLSMDKSFVFPDAFLSDKPFLETNDKELLALIDEESNSVVCEKCGSYSKDLKMILGKALCPDCRRDYVICSTCGKWYIPIKKEYEDDYKQCEDCFNKTHRKCTVCGELWPEEGLNSSKDYVDVCDDCIDDYLEYCEGCDDYFPKDKMICDEQLGWICPQCNVNNVGFCTCCGSKMFKSKAYDKDTICWECGKKAEWYTNYYSYVDTLDFSTLSIEEYSFRNLKKMRTTVLMSRLRHWYEYTGEHDDKDKQSFDVLLIDTPCGQLVILFQMPRRLRYEMERLISSRIITLTDFKKVGWEFLFWGDTCIDHDVKELSTGRQFHIWETPYLLKAQTDANKQYGNIYHGEDLVRAGDLYGATSTFFIVGYIDKE